MTASMQPTDVHETVSKLARIAPTLPSGTFCCVAELYEKLNAGDWRGIAPPTRRRIGIEFRKLVDRGEPSDTTHGSAGLRRVGKNERQQTVYEVIRRRSTR